MKIGKEAYDFRAVESADSTRIYRFHWAYKSHLLCMMEVVFIIYTNN